MDSHRCYNVFVQFAGNQNQLAIVASNSNTAASDHIVIALGRMYDYVLNAGQVKSA